MPRLASPRLLPLLLLVFLAVPLPAIAASIGGALVTIAPDGVVHVTLWVLVSRGANSVVLPVAPIPGTIVVRVDGREVPPVYVDGVLYIFSPIDGNASIDYIANITVRDGIYSLRVNGSAVLAVSPNIVLLTVPNVTSVESRGKYLLFHLTGVNTIKYTIAKAGATTTTLITTPTTARTTSGVETAPVTRAGGGTVSKPTSTARGVSGLPLGYLGAALATIVVLAALALLVARRHGGTASTTPGSTPGVNEGGGGGVAVTTGIELSDNDRLVLEKLREAGGVALQSELQRATGLPKTTLWRTVKRLEKLGLVEVVKDSQGRNVVRLKV